MALTQTATIPGPGPSWDEEVVPVLRKRLESESRALSRRLSATPMSAGEDYHHHMSDSQYHGSQYAGSSNYTIHQSYQNGATSRPAQQTRTSSEQNVHSRVNGTRSSAPKISNSRSRTHSQPYKPEYTNARPNNTKINGVTPSSDTYSISSSASRPFSPYSNSNSNIKPSRIPQPTRTRTASLSSNNYAPFPNGSIPTSTSPSPYSSPRTPDPRLASSSDLWRVQEDGSHSSISVSISKQRSGILNEQPPFQPGPNPSDDSLTETPPRMSTDSQERPFEHWYRGDVSRNGGVGELRVGKRQEMLDIANYGHRPNKPVVRNAITDAIDRRRRKRADSVGQHIERTSFYMDEEQAKNVGRVLDEGPPTDVDEGDTSILDDYYDDDDDEEGEEEYDNENNGDTLVLDADMSTMSAPLPNSLDQRSTTPTANHSRLPRATTPTASQYQRGMSEPPSVPSSAANLSTPPTSRSKQQAQQLRSTSTSPSGQPGKRAISPGASTPTSSAKKSRMNASKATQAKLAAQKKKEKEEEEARRKQAAQYPDPGDDTDMAHAIPTWTQPVPKQGNWDDVVLPTVARKKGLADQYEQADGSPKPKHESHRPEPAPGTFGYDPSKYRPRGENGEAIPMDEFGRPQEEEIPESSPAKPSENDQFNMSISQLQEQQQRRFRPEPPASPVPFAQYHSSQPVVHLPPSTHVKPEQEQQKQPEPMLEEKEAGCCRCVVM